MFGQALKLTLEKNCILCCLCGGWCLPCNRGAIQKYNINDAKWKDWVCCLFCTACTCCQLIQQIEKQEQVTIAACKAPERQVKPGE